MRVGHVVDQREVRELLGRDLPHHGAQICRSRVAHQISDLHEEIYADPVGPSEITQTSSVSLFFLQRA